MRFVLRRELLIFGILVLILAPIVHPDLLSNPQERFTHMMERENYFHPLAYSAIAYTLILLLRTMTMAIKKLFSPKK